MVDNCLAYVESYVTKKSHHLLLSEDRVLSWIPPPQGKVKLKFDGAVFQFSGHVGIGMIVEDDK